MKLSHIQIDNFAGIASLDIKVTAPILLCAGPNGASKSYIADAVKMAMTRTLPRGLTKKNELGMLLNDGTGAKAGGILVECDNDNEATFGAILPKGDFTGPELPDAMLVALDGQRFAQMTADERRTFLFRLTKSGAKPEVVGERLIKSGCRADLVDEVLPMLRSGFPKACEFAKDEAKQKKAEWKAITATTYGSVLADSWAAPVPDLPAGDAAAARARVDGLDQQIATLNQALGTIRAAARQATEAAQKRTSLSASAARVPELEKLLPAAITERDEYKVKVEVMRERAKGKARVGLVHDMARFINGLRASITTPEAATAQAMLLMQYAKEYGDIDKAATPDMEAVASLPEHEKGLTVLTNRASNLQRDLDAARAAKLQYDELGQMEDAADVSAELAEVEQQLEEAKVERQQVMNEALNIEAAIKNRAEAKSKTARAKALHDHVVAWLAIADQLVPSGIPAQILAEALKPVNDKLAQASVDSDWPCVAIDSDMGITITRDKARPYGLESESFRWRADAHIAAVVAEISGLGILCLDRCDVLQPAARPELFSWIDLLVNEGVIDSALLAMTLSKKPIDVLDSFQVEWINAGAIEGETEREAA